MIQSKNSLVYKYLTNEIYNRLKHIKTTNGFTLTKAISCSLQLDNQHCGIYGGDYNSYKDFSEIFDPIIQDYHKIAPYTSHISDIDVNKIHNNISVDAPIHSTRIRVSRSIDGFNLSPIITKKQRSEIENIMITVFKDMSGRYLSLKDMNNDTQQKLIDEKLLFISTDVNLELSGMKRNWPNNRGIFYNDMKDFSIWVNEEDHLRIISTQKGSDFKEVFNRLIKGINDISESIGRLNKSFCLDEKYGYINSCPTNLGTGLRASVHIDLVGWANYGVDKLKLRCDELDLQCRGVKGESVMDGWTYDISNRHRLGYTEVELIQKTIDGVNILWQEDKELLKKLSKI